MIDVQTEPNLLFNQQRNYIFAQTQTISEGLIINSSDSLFIILLFKIMNIYII